MKKKHLFVVGAIIAIIALFGFGKVDAKADMEVVTDWFSEPHSEYFVYADCVEETNVTGSTEHYVYERYLWHDGKTWRATGVKLVPSDYSFNKLVTSGDYSGAGKNTKKYNIWRSQEYDYAVSEASNGGYNVVDSNGNAFHAWSYYTVTVSAGSTQYRYRYSRTHNEYVTYLNGCYHIRTVPGWTFDVAGWGTESGTNLIIWEFSGQANQTFRFSLQNDGSYIITDQNSGLCMDVDGDTVDGTNICMKTYNGGTSQRWYVGANSDGTYSLVSALFRVFVADVAWGEDNKNGSNVFLWQWHGGQNQRFYIEKVDEEPPVQQYNRDEVVKFIRKAYNTNVQACVSLGSSALYVGNVPGKESFAKETKKKGYYGYKAKITTVGDFWRAVVDKGLGTAEKLDFNGNKVTNKDIRPGDILIVKNDSWYYHLAVISSVEYDNNGYATIKYCQRASSHLDKELKSSWASWSGWKSHGDAYAYVIKITC